MSTISSIHSREILDSRGNPTLETIIVLSNGVAGIASVPSGASVGVHEAVELRDNDPKRYHGMGVLNAIANVETVIAPKLRGKEASKQKEIDDILLGLDGTDNKSHLGANSMLSVSLSCAAASANERKIPLYEYLRDIGGEFGIGSSGNTIPHPLLNIINGGAHGSGNLEIQEFHIIPLINPFSEAIRIGTEVYHTLKSMLKKRELGYSMGDEGGFTPRITSNTEALDLLGEAITNSGYTLGREIGLGLDIASSHFYKDGKYIVSDKNGALDTNQFISYIQELVDRFHLLYVEDALSEDDWAGWGVMTNRFQQKTTIVGDDFLVTNPKRLQEAIEKRACTGILVKPNQIGTLSETLEVIALAKKNTIKTIVSHRSGETNDSFIADLAVAASSDYVKFGAPARGERVAKYNRLLEIENRLPNTIYDKACRFNYS